MFLYDIVNDKDIKLTDADVSNEWLTSKHDWSDTNPEVLLVRYVRAKTGGANAVVTDPSIATHSFHQYASDVLKPGALA